MNEIASGLVPYSSIVAVEDIDLFFGRSFLLELDIQLELNALIIGLVTQHKTIDAFDHDENLIDDHFEAKGKRNGVDGSKNRR